MKTYDPLPDASPFAVVSAVRRRASQLVAGAEPLVAVTFGETPASVAEREVLAGVVRFRLGGPGGDFAPPGERSRA